MTSFPRAVIAPAALALTSVFVAGVAHAEAGDWIVRD